jgi:hypothetical protein
MTTKRISTAAAAALLATTLGASIALAQTSTAPAPQQAPLPHQGMTMGQAGKDNGGMMDMTQMNKMMENCNRMMESKQHPSANPKPDNG